MATLAGKGIAEARKARSGRRKGPRVSIFGKYTDARGVVDVSRMASGLFISRDQLAKTAGLPTTTVTKRERSLTAKPQSRLREMLEILARVEDWAGGEAQALAWYRAQPIPALDGRTAEALVQDGRAASVRNYLDHLALGGFA
jgi:uncharacterized protein (DUF2384 family)